MGQFSCNRLQKHGDAFKLAHLGYGRLPQFNCSGGFERRQVKGQREGCGGFLDPPPRFYVSCV
jgi:hypothetical protein